MAYLERSDRKESQMKWAFIWFRQVAAFHQRPAESSWKFSAEDVIAFSRHKRDEGTPAWKRKSMVEGLIAYRREVQKINADDFSPIRQKLGEIVGWERAQSQGAEDIQEVVGKINEREPDVIQAFRRRQTARQGRSAVVSQQFLLCLAIVKDLQDEHPNKLLDPLCIPIGPRILAYYVLNGLDCR